MGSLETALNSGFEAVQGQTCESALLKAADFGENVMMYIGISILYFPKLCLGSHQILNLSHPKKREQSWMNREKLKCQENLTGRLVRRNMEGFFCLQDNFFHFKSVAEEYLPCWITESMWGQHVQWSNMSVVAHRQGFYLQELGPYSGSYFCVSTNSHKLAEWNSYKAEDCVHVIVICRAFPMDLCFF